MKIKELYIAEFGGIRDKKIELDTDNGLNIIYGENESGKRKCKFISFNELQEVINISLNKTTEKIANLKSITIFRNFLSIILKNK